MLGFDAQDKVGSFFLSFIYFVAGIPLAFLFWYKKLYDATAADSARSYVAFFIWYLAHCGFCVFATIAAPISTGRWSFAGFVSSMQALTVSKPAASVALQHPARLFCDVQALPAGRSTCVTPM